MPREAWYDSTCFLETSGAAAGNLREHVKKAELTSPPPVHFSGNIYHATFKTFFFTSSSVEKNGQKGKGSLGLLIDFFDVLH